MHYLISNYKTSHDLGVYEADSPDAAIAAMLRDAREPDDDEAVEAARAAGVETIVADSVLVSLAYLCRELEEGFALIEAQSLVEGNA